MAIVHRSSTQRPAAEERVFSARGLTKVYRMGDVEVHALRGIDLDLFAGEFIVLLGDANRAVAEEVAQRIRNVVFSTTLEVDVKMVRIKVSVGVATFPEDGNALQPVMAAADRAMYKDKQHTEPKGRVVFRRR